MSNGILGVIGAYSKGAPVRIISAEGTGAGDAFWYAPTQSGIKSLKDTNGKTVAFSSPGSSTNLILLQLVKQAGATPKLVPTGGAPATYTQVMTGQIDVGWSVPPFALKDLLEGKIAIIARGNDVEAIKAQTVRVNVANANALKQKREAFVNYVKALGRAVDWAYSSPDALSNYAAIARVPVDQANDPRRLLSKGGAPTCRDQRDRRHPPAGARLQVRHKADDEGGRGAFVRHAGDRETLGSLWLPAGRFMPR
jgi:NitT/TauT family transport system substrate-binding protein